MIIALLHDSTGYRIVGIIHVVAVVVAFGPLFFYPALQRAGATSTVATLHTRLVLPALVALGILGAAMVGMSDDTFKMSDTWVSLAFVIWLAAIAVSWLLVRPALTDSGEAARSKLAMGTGITHLLLVVGLYVMVFKPGWP